MDWTGGYVSDVEYMAWFCREQSPAFMNFVCLLNGIEPVALDKPFAYFELGSGRGLTVNVLAASNPQGRFYANDFNPAHVVDARELATAAQLSNVTHLENSFAELAAGKVADLPQFDFISLQGIYTWVSEENRWHIVDFIGRYLKPGGIVYIGYNAMPGWSAAAPLQRLLVEHADLYPNRSDTQIRQGEAFVGKMVELQAKYFKTSPMVRPWLDIIKKGNPHYLAHEYLNRVWQPMYHVDVARDMSAAKLDFAGSAVLPFAFPCLCLSPEAQELLNGIPDTALRETWKDYFFNSNFRKDIFVRGARRMTRVRKAEWLARTGLALQVPLAEVNLKLSLPKGEFKFDPAIYAPVLDALAKGPHTLAELAALPALKEQQPEMLWQVAALLAATDSTCVYFTDSAGMAAEPAHRMNLALAERARYGDEYQTFVSPLLGSGLPSSYVERLLYLLLSQQPQEQDSTALARQVWQIIAAQGRRLGKKGTTYDTEEAALDQLREEIETTLAQMAPIWRQLKMIG